MKTTVLLRNPLRRVLWATALLVTFYDSALAKEGFTGDGFGGRKWYVPATTEVDYAQLGATHAIIMNGRLLMWAQIISSGTHAPMPGIAGVIPTSIPSQNPGIMGLNPTYFNITGMNGTNWVTDYRSGGEGTWYPACPSCFGLGGIGSVTVPTSLSGAVNCGASAIVGNLLVGTPSNVMLKVTATVSTTGTGSFTVSGSGLTPSALSSTFSATTTGLQTFYLSMDYDGSALGTTTFTLGGLGVCSADLSSLTMRPVITPITPLANCVAVTPIVLSK